MMKTLLRSMAVGFLVFALPHVARADRTAGIGQAAKEASAAEAAPFLGDWTLAMQGANGPASMTLSINADKGKVSAEITSDATAKQAISSISLVDKSLVLAYSFNYEGMPIDAIVYLTPDKEGKTAAQIDFAGGAYVMNGTATKKEQ